MENTRVLSTAQNVFSTTRKKKRLVSSPAAPIFSTVLILHTNIKVSEATEQLINEESLWN